MAPIFRNHQAVPEVVHAECTGCMYHNPKGIWDNADRCRCRFGVTQGDNAAPCVLFHNIYIPNTEAGRAEYIAAKARYKLLGADYEV